MSNSDKKYQRTPTILLIDDDEAITMLLSGVLSQSGIQLTAAPTGEAGLTALRQTVFDLVLLDLNLPDYDGISLLEKIVTENLSTEVVVLTGDHSMESTVGTVRRGALDYVTKPFQPRQLAERILTLLARQSEGRTAPENALDRAAASGIVGRSSALRELAEKITRIGPHFRNVLITGPTGSGKELIARFLHKTSGGSGGFTVFNCGAVPESLFKSELFGHLKGSFTGAIQDRAGIAEQADGGTLFIDEVGELTPPMQAALLRLVQNRESKRLGSTTVRRLNIRMIAATNRDIPAMVESRSFREDLYHRLSTVEIRVPSLQERTEDIPLLTDYFLAAFCSRYNKPQKRLTPGAQKFLAGYPWPGNIRELESVLDYCCLMCTGDEIRETDLPGFVRADSQPEQLRSLKEMDLLHLENALRRSGGNREEAAEQLGVGRATLYRMIADLKKDVR